MTIVERTEYVSFALEHTYTTISGDCQIDQSVDIIADIMHWCDAAGVSFENLVMHRARMHYAAELEEAVQCGGSHSASVLH